MSLRSTNKLYFALKCFCASDFINIAYLYTPNTYIRDILFRFYLSYHIHAVS